MPVLSRVLSVQALLALFTIAIANLLFKLIQKRLRLREIPGPHLNFSNLFLGHVLQMRQSPTGTVHNNWNKKYGHVYKSYGPFLRPTLHLTDPKAINHVLLNTSIYHRHDEEKVAIETWFGKCLLSSEDNDHKRMRKLLNVAFTPQSVQDVSGVIFDLAHKLKSQWEDIIDESGSPSTTFDVTKLVHETTLDAISMTAFMYDCSSSSGTIPDLLRNFSNAPILDAKDILLKSLVTQFPILLHIPAPMQKFAQRLKSELGAIAGDVWSGVKNSSSGDLHAKLLNALASESAITCATVSKDEAASHIIEILFAGSETTANVFTECLYELSHNPKIQKRLRDELIQFEITTGREPNYDDLNNANALPYLDAVIRETTRTKAVLMYIARKPIKTDTIPLKYPIKGTKNTHHIEVHPGQRIEVMLRDGVNINEDIWGPDAAVFRPERWIEEGGLPESVAEIRAQGNVLSFGDGPKICLGRSFALAELRILIAVIIRHFTFDSDGLLLDIYYPGGDTFKPYVRGRKEEGVQMPLRVGKY